LQLPEGAELQRLPSGRYRIVLPVRPPQTVRTVLYARVSESSNRKHLRQQMTLLRAWAKREGAHVVDEVQEVGRPQDPSMTLHELLADPTIHRIVVLGKDRVGAFSFPLLESTLRASGRELIVLDPEWMDVRDVLREVSAMHKIMTQITEEVYAHVDGHLRDDQRPRSRPFIGGPHLVPEP
jgi:predicted site-specific integrase-resolvase